MLLRAWWVGSPVLCTMGLCYLPSCTLVPNHTPRSQGARLHTDPHGAGTHNLRIMNPELHEPGVPQKSVYYQNFTKIHQSVSLITPILLYIIYLCDPCIQIIICFTSVKAMYNVLFPQNLQSQWTEVNQPIIKYLHLSTRWKSWYFYYIEIFSHTFYSLQISVSSSTHIFFYYETYLHQLSFIKILHSLLESRQSILCLLSMFILPYIFKAVTLYICFMFL